MRNTTQFAPELLQPIPLEAGRIPQGWREVPIPVPSEDPLVPIGPFSHYAPTVFTSGVYAGEHRCSPYFGQPLNGATITAFLRKSVAERLEHMQQALPWGHHLVVFDAYRGEETQIALFKRFRHTLARQYPEKSDAELDEITQVYVSTPSANPPSPHRTGGAIDVAIVKMPPKLAAEPIDHARALLDIHTKLRDANAISPSAPLDTTRAVLEIKRNALIQCARMLNFGTAFDHGGKRAQLTYFEEQVAAGNALSASDEEAMNNRRILYNISRQYDFVPYAEEWWHLDPVEAQRAAAAIGKPEASFGPMELSVQNLAHEQLRVTRLGAVAIARSEGNWPIEIIAPQS